MNKIDKLKNYFSDKTIKGYNVSIKLINKEEYIFKLSNDEFNKLKEWYINSQENTYQLNFDNKYYNLNKEHIVEFEYEDITNTKDFKYKFAYFFTIPVPRFMNMFNFLKLSIITSFIGVISFIFKGYIKNVSINDILKNIEVYKNSINFGFNITLTLFLTFMIIFIIENTLNIQYKKIYYYDELKKNKNKPLYNFTIINMFFLIWINLMLK